MKKLFILLTLALSTSAFADSKGMFACYQIGFPNQASLEKCVYSGASEDTVKACLEVGFTKAKDLNECISSKQSVARIRSCYLSGIDSASEVNRCITRTTLKFERKK